MLLKIAINRCVVLVLKHIQFLITILKNIFVHCNIIDSVNYGNTKLNILKILPIKYYNNSMKFILKSPSYVDVKNTIINSINIEFCDELGTYINCENFFTQILISLHFKPKKPK